MANDLTNIMAKILANGLMTLREQCVMPRIVNGDYSSEAAMKGATIDVPIPTATTTKDVVPSHNQSAPTSNTPSLVQISLDNWKSSNFFMSDKDMVQVDKNKHFLPMQAAEAIRALSNDVNASIHQNYKGVYGFTGDAGVTPFASTVVGATNSRKVLNKQLAPRSTRRGVLDFDAEANALALAPFADADKTMSAQVKIEGEIGRKYGIDWMTDDVVPTHVAGTLQATGAILDVDAAVGDETLTIVSASAVGNVVEGDIFTLAGDTQTYVIGADVSAIASGVGKVVAIQPPLKVAAVSTVAITIKATHVVNIVMHRDAYAFANRPLVQSTQDMELGSKIMSMTDPKTGISLRLEVSRQHKQVVWEFDILWGDGLVRPELATRLAG